MIENLNYLPWQTPWHFVIWLLPLLCKVWLIYRNDQCRQVIWIIPFNLFILFFMRKREMESLNSRNERENEPKSKRYILCFHTLPVGVHLNMVLPCSRYGRYHPWSEISAEEWNVSIHKSWSIAISKARCSCVVSLNKDVMELHSTGFFKPNSNVIFNVLGYKCLSISSNTLAKNLLQCRAWTSLGANAETLR